MRTNFVVSVTHENKPMAGASVEVYGSGENGEAALLLLGKSEADGTFVVANLRPGDYWLGVTLLGVRAAGSDCFYVTNRPSRKAKRALQYSWGDNPLVVPQLAGKLMERQPGTGGKPEGILSPIPKATLTLRNTTSGASYTTTTTEDASFAFDRVPSGVYVLEVEYENQPNHDPRPDHLVVKINPNANAGPLSLIRMQSGDETYLAPSTPRN